MNPKPSYIKIKSISEIDTNKISVSQINQRFIDEQKNRYVLRFNKITRRIEILKVLANGELELVNSGMIASEPKKASNPDPAIKTDSNVKPKTNSVLESFLTEKSEFESHNKSDLMDESLDLDIFQEPPPRPAQKQTSPNKEIPQIAKKTPAIRLSPIVAPGLTDHQRIDYFFDLMESHKDRLTHIIENLKQSMIFEATGDPSENKNIVGNFERELIFEVFQEIERINFLHKEIKTFPRQISFYISKLPIEHRDLVNDLESDKEKLDFIYVFEMKRGIDSCLKKMKQFSQQLLSLINLKSEPQIKQLQYQNQLLFADSKNAAIFFAQELDGILNDLKTWIK